MGQSNFLVHGHQPKWWKESVVYQVYPASFQDSNNDGIGDIPGMISRLDYIKALGVDVIWLSPHYRSPQIDMGYDISDFEAVHEPYGTMQDCDRLIQETHARGMKIIFDLVINHTSDQHEWFRESRKSKTNPKRDWYFWRPARYDSAGNRQRPTNWRSNFGGPAWTWDEETQEYYLHIYAPEQPDLNWENQECRRAVYATSIRFWLDKGIDGFRIDTVNKYSKDVTFPDAEVLEPHEEYQVAIKHFSNGPRMREFLLEMNDIFDEYDVMTVGELPNTPNDSDVRAYVSASARQLNMVFNFDVVQLGQKKGDRLFTVPFTKNDFKYHISHWQKFVNNSDTWTTAFLENHDQGRSITRFASDSARYRSRCGKMFAVLLATMTGTLFLYQGQEIGMINIPRSWPAEEYLDIRSVNHYENVTKKSKADPTALSQALDGMQIAARDHARTPMQWTSSMHNRNVGFCSPDVKPWMRAIDNGINVQDQLHDTESVLSFWKEMIQLRKKHRDLFVYGHFEEEKENRIQIHPSASGGGSGSGVDEDEDAEDIFSFSKSTTTPDGGAPRRALVVINLGENTRTWRRPLPLQLVPKEGETTGEDSWELLVGNLAVTEEDHAVLRPYEARVYLSRSG